MADYGSGTLGPWTGNQHGTYIPSGKALGDCDLLLIGDSISNLGKEEFAASMLTNHGADVAVNYWSGRPTTNGVDYLVSLTTVPRVVVMAKGSNDVMDPTVMAAQIQRVKQNIAAREAATGQSIELRWVDVQVARPAFGINDQRNSGWVNNQIHAAMGNDVISWARWFSVKPSRLVDYIDPGGVHPKPGVGTNFWAEVIRQGVASLF